MKYLLMTFLLTQFIHSGNCITTYKTNDILFIWAESGLNLREKPNSKSKILAKIAFADSILCKGNKSNFDYIHNSEFILDSNKIENGETRKIKLKGNWVQVKYNGIIGFVFDSYLSKLKPITENSRRLGFIGFLKKELEVIKWLEKIDTTAGCRKNKFLLENGAFVEEDCAPGGSWLSITIPEFSSEEAFLMIRFYNKYITETSQNNEGHIHISQDLGGYEIKQFENVVIIYGEWSC